MALITVLIEKDRQSNTDAWARLSDSTWIGPNSPKVLGHIGARGTAYWNVRLLDHIFGFEEIRVHSRRRESREAFGERLSNDLGRNRRSKLPYGKGVWIKFRNDSCLLRLVCLGR